MQIRIILYSIISNPQISKLDSEAKSFSNGIFLVVIELLCKMQTPPRFCLDLQNDAPNVYPLRCMLVSLFFWTNVSERQIMSGILLFSKKNHRRIPLNNTILKTEILYFYLLN